MKGADKAMTKRVLIGMAILLFLILATLLCVILLQQQVPLDGTLV